MTETPVDTTVDTLAVAKRFGKAVTKELAYEAGVHVAAITILLGIGVVVHKVQQRRVKPIPVVVVEP